ncbi:hypothetical protein RRF57_008025 [Xylaria bambusicola]|uniref:Uncharacterized protein n=1 Tax=Xylaria bambusicola TaxID=326684 RepID=A0AAN7UT15_9PEZI
MPEEGNRRGIVRSRRSRRDPAARRFRFSRNGAPVAKQGPGGYKVGRYDLLGRRIATTRRDELAQAWKAACAPPPEPARASGRGD